MSELEIVATFDTQQTARAGTKLLNSWFSWIMEGERDEVDELEELFDEFGLSASDFSLDPDHDVEWGEIPEAHLEGNRVVVTLDSKTGVDTVRELFEAMGAYEVQVCGEDD